MGILIAGIILFFGIHVVPAVPSLKQALIGRMGEMAYKGLFTLVSFAGLGLMIWGFSSREFVPLYEPPEWGRSVTMVLVFLAMVCLATAQMKSHIRRFLSHPMLVGMGLWATGHLLANGDKASVLLFGAFLAYAVLDIVLASAQGRVKTFEPKISHDVISIVAGAAVYAVFILLHQYIIGVAVI